jgi:hypothetical protein
MDRKKLTPVSKVIARCCKFDELCERAYAKADTGKYANWQEVAEAIEAEDCPAAQQRLKADPIRTKMPLLASEKPRLSFARRAAAKTTVERGGLAPVRRPRATPNMRVARSAGPPIATLGVQVALFLVPWRCAAVPSKTRP